MSPATTMRTALSEIWSGASDDLMRGLRQSPRPVKGRCAGCRYLAICNGNTRVRAYHMSGDFWEEDPGCYLSNEEIGIATTPRRLAVPSREIPAHNL